MEPASSPIFFVRKGRCRLISSDSEPESQADMPRGVDNSQSADSSPEGHNCGKGDTGNMQPGNTNNPFSPDSPDTEVFNTPSVLSISSGSSSPVIQENFIEFQHEGPVSTWSSDEESVLDTSAPRFKRGEHRTQTQPQSKSARGGEKCDNPMGNTDEDKPIRELIRKEGVEAHNLPPALKRRKPPSVNLLADHQLQEWPIGEQFCKITFSQHLPLAGLLEKEIATLRCTHYCPLPSKVTPHGQHHSFKELAGTDMQGDPGGGRHAHLRV